MKPYEDKTKPGKLWNDKEGLNSEQIFDDTKKVTLIFKYVW